MKFLRIAGFLSLFFGTLALLSTFQIAFLFLGLIAAIIGFIFSIIYIFIKTRNQVDTGFVNPGMVGMLMSSVPVIFLMYKIFSQSSQ